MVYGYGISIKTIGFYITFSQKITLLVAIGQDSNTFFDSQQGYEF